MNEQEHNSKTPGQEKPASDKMEDQPDDDLWPKAAEPPDPTVYMSADINTLLDISKDAPPEIRSRAVELVKKHIKAFGFDG